MNSTTATTTPRTRHPLLQNGMVLNGKWEILGHIATGGKGEIYLAKQTNLDREVVVKIVSVEYLAEFGDDEEEVQTEMNRFHREAMAMAQIRHPYVLQVYDQDAATIVKGGTDVSIQYVVMEYVPGGRTLRHTMPCEGYKEGEKDLRHWILTYFLPLFHGLETVHALGIVHRDMKPENVLMDGPNPKITDFGIAGGPRWAQLTKSHHVEGTITYMAPEQFMDLGDTDARADVYALGKMLYEAVQGKMVDNKTACPLKGVCLSHPNTSFLQSLDLIVQQATAEDKEERTPSVEAFREALELLLEKTEAAERPLLKGLHKKQIVFIVGTIVAIVAVSNLYHHFVMTHEAPLQSVPSPSVSQPVLEPGGQIDTETQTLPERDANTPTISGRDGSLMRKVPAGQVVLPGYVGFDAGKTMDVPPFYLDETEVTNYKYVEFLNQVLSRITVKEGVIRSEGRIWLIMGPVYGGYEPIVFQNGRFLLQDAAAASRPVVKVTGNGAAAYATFYGKRLPSETEWLRAAGRREHVMTPPLDDLPVLIQGTDDLQAEMEALVGGFNEDRGRLADTVPKQTGRYEYPSSSAPPQGPSQIPYPVSRFDANVDGIRGLEANVSEWGLRPGPTQNSEPQFVVLGGLRGTTLRGAAPFPGIAQDPSMAFEDVGFRCAKNAQQGKR